MSDIISFAELQNIAACKKPSLVMAWLQKNGIPFLIARNGYPRVHRLALAAKMGAPISGPDEKQNDKIIDFSAIGG